MQAYFAEALIYFECYCSLLIVQRDTERKTINQEEHQPNNKEMRSTNLVCCPFLCIPCCRSINQFSFFFLFRQPSWAPFFSVLWTNIREKLSVVFFSTTWTNVTYLFHSYLICLWWGVNFKFELLCWNETRFISEFIS